MVVVCEDNTVVTVCRARLMTSLKNLEKSFNLVFGIKWDPGVYITVLEFSSVEIEFRCN